MHRTVTAAFLGTALSACAPTVWEKPGAGDAEFRRDALYCRSGAPSVFAAEACMRARGWSKSSAPGNPNSTISGFVGAPDAPAPPRNFLPQPVGNRAMQAPSAPEPTARPALQVFNPHPPPPMHCIGQVPIPGLAIGPDCP